MKRLNWNHIKATGMIVLSLGFMSLGFQNCSKVGVADLGSAGDSAKLDNSDCAGCTVDPSGDGSGTLPGNDSSGNNGNTNSGNSHNGNTDNGQPNKQPLSEEAVAVAECLSHEGVFLSGPAVQHTGGDTQVRSDDITSISFVGGNLKLVGKTANAKAGTIDTVNGNVLLCGVEVDNLLGVKGNVVMVNSIVHNLDGVNGYVRANAASELGSYSNVNGTVLPLK